MPSIGLIRLNEPNDGHILCAVEELEVELVLVNNPIVESIGSDRWRLVGSVMTAAHFTMMGRSLKLIRRFDGLSPRIRFAMNVKSTLPVVEINASEGRFTLAGARIVNIIPVSHQAPKHGTHPAYELEEIDFTFASITHSGKGGKKGMADNWSSGG